MPFPSGIVKVAPAHSRNCESGSEGCGESSRIISSRGLAPSSILSKRKHATGLRNYSSQRKNFPNFFALFEINEEIFFLRPSSQQIKTFSVNVESL